MISLVVGAPGLYAQEKSKQPLNKETKISLIAAGSVLTAGAIIAIVYFVCKSYHSRTSKLIPQIGNGTEAQSSDIPESKQQSSLVQNLQSKVSEAVTLIHKAQLHVFKQPKDVQHNAFIQLGANDTYLYEAELLAFNLQQAAQQLALKLKPKEIGIKANIGLLCKELWWTDMNQLLPKEEYNSLWAIMHSNYPSVEERRAISYEDIKLLKSLCQIKAIIYTHTVDIQ